MAEDFRIQVETDLDTAKAEQKLNALLKEKRQIKLDIDINNQNIKNISKNIEKGIKKYQNRHVRYNKAVSGLF